MAGMERIIDEVAFALIAIRLSSDNGISIKTTQCYQR